VRDGSEYTVTMDDGRELDAQVIGSDDKTDLALLKVEGDGFTYVTFSNDEPKVGQWVLAVGNPFGLGGSVSAGIISAMHRDIGSGPYDNYLQIDAPVNRGNSGGPAFNTHGEVIGVNTAIFSPSGGNVGIAFAIPANIAADVINDLKTNGSVTRGGLGVVIQPVTDGIAETLGVDGTKGALVASVNDGSPARGAGVRVGDVISEVNGNAVDSPKQLSRMIARLEPGEKIKLTVMREGKTSSIDVTLGNLDEIDSPRQASAEPQDAEQPAQTGSLGELGLTLEASPDGDGMRVAAVEDGSAAAEAGIREGSVIVAAGYPPRDVKGASDIEDEVTAARNSGRETVLLRVKVESGPPLFVGVMLDRG
jgi:serine protease Do